MTQPPTDTPALLREWRAKHQWSQQRLADALGVRQHTVTRWETGERTCSMPVVLALALRELERGL